MVKNVLSERLIHFKRQCKVKSKIKDKSAELKEYDLSLKVNQY